MSQYWFKIERRRQLSKKEQQDFLSLEFYFVANLSSVCLIIYVYKWQLLDEDNED